MAHNSFSFDGGEILGKMGASWFVSYAYYNYIDKSHMNWNSTATAATRISKYNRSKQYHMLWLTEVLSMNPLNLNKNQIGLRSDQIKEMASQILNSRKGIE